MTTFTIPTDTVTTTIATTIVTSIFQTVTKERNITRDLTVTVNSTTPSADIGITAIGEAIQVLGFIVAALLLGLIEALIFRCRTRKQVDLAEARGRQQVLSERARQQTSLLG